MHITFAVINGNQLELRFALVFYRNVFMSKVSSELPTYERVFFPEVWYI
jgi:hypothetical protein